MVINAPSAAITGNTYVQAEAFDPPMIDVPGDLSVLASSGTLTSDVTLTGDVRYDAIDLGSNDEMIIDGNVRIYITGDMKMGKFSEIRIVDAALNPNASLTLYVAGDYTQNQQSLMNNVTQDTSKFTPYGLPTCQNVTLSQAGMFYGVVYAPNADVQIDQGTQIYGSVSGDSVTLDRTSELHYDASLRDVGINEVGVRFVIKRWSED